MEYPRDVGGFERTASPPGASQLDAKMTHLRMAAIKHTNQGEGNKKEEERTKEKAKGRHTRQPSPQHQSTKRYNHICYRSVDL